MNAIEDMAAEAANRLKTRHADDGVWFGKLVDQLASIEQTAEPGAVISAYLSAVQFFFVAQDVVLAIHLAERALRIAIAHDHKSQARHLYNNLGVLYTEADQPNRAVPHLIAGLRLAMEIGDAAGECKLWGNLAKVANHSGLLREAIEYARRALALAGHVEGAGETRMQANQIIGAAYLHLNLFTEGLVAIQNAVREVPKSESALAMLQICRLRCWEANLLIRVGRYEEAAASIGIAADCARKSGNDECIVAVKVVGMVLDAKRDAELAPIALAELKRMLQDPIHRGQRADLIRSLAYLAETYAPEEVTTIRRLVHEYWTRKGIDSVAEQLATLGLASGSAATTANA